MNTNPTENTTNTSETEMLTNIISRVSNLFYETIFIVDVADGKITYLPPKSGLAKMLIAEESDISTLSQLMYRLGKTKTDKFTQVLKAIKTFYNESAPEERNDILFVFDMPFHINDLRHSTLTIKFTPFAEDSNHSLSRLLCTLSMSSGTHPETLHSLNTLTSERSQYYFTTKRWSNSSTYVLTEIERHVLCLSAEGLSVPEISEVIYRAQDSIKSIRKRIFEKLGARNITEAIIYATNYKII